MLSTDDLQTAKYKLQYIRRLALKERKPWTAVREARRLNSWLEIRGHRLVFDATDLLKIRPR